MDRKIDYLIVGQGIAGTILSYKLIKKGYLVKVIDDGHRTASSTKAAGIEIDMKFPKAIPKAETPCSLYLITFTFME